tara:strand:- start:48 stop:1331 length:1284 start_codon:yes stop_codon:yes gene_type:complete
MNKMLLTQTTNKSKLIELFSQYSTIGVELEGMYVDKDGYVVNIAQIISKDPRLKDADWLDPEGLQCQWEVKTNPSHNIRGMDLDLRLKLTYLAHVAQDYGVYIVPMGEVGAGQGKVNLTTPKAKERILIYNQLFGEERVRALLSNSGTHIHLSQTPGKEVMQYVFGESLESLIIGLTSTSPINHKGVNKLRNHRTRVQGQTFDPLSIFYEPHKTPQSLDDIKNIQEETLAQTRALAIQLGISPEIFDSFFHLDDISYHGVRNRKKNGLTGTNEFRRPGACSPHIISPTAAFIKGTWDYIDNRNLKLKIGDKNEYRISATEIIIPSPEYIRTNRELAIERGLDPNSTITKLQYLLPYAEKGLPQIDKPFLQPFKQVLKTGRTPDKDMMDYMTKLNYSGLHYEPDQTAKLVQHQVNLNQKDLNLLPIPR